MKPYGTNGARSHCSACGKRERPKAKGKARAENRAAPEQNEAEHVAEFDLKTELQDAGIVRFEVTAILESGSGPSDSWRRPERFLARAVNTHGDVGEAFATDQLGAIELAVAKVRLRSLLHPRKEKP